MNLRSDVVLIGITALGAAVYYATRPNQQAHTLLDTGDAWSRFITYDHGKTVPAIAQEPEMPGVIGTWVEDFSAKVQTMVTGNWTPPARAEQYLPEIRSTEKMLGMPENLLARLIYQESRYREDIITGKTVSSAGALGIAQIVPKWHPGVNPLNPTEAIRYAGKYLKQNYNQFKSWDKALAAYNWGPGNLAKAIAAGGDWLARAPKETQDYVLQIGGDVGLV